MIVLSDQGLVIVNTNFTKDDCVATLPSIHSFAFNFTLTVGVAIPPYGVIEETEVWCFSMHDKNFRVISGFDMLIPNVTDVPFGSSEVENSIGHVSFVRLKDVMIWM